MNAPNDDDLCTCGHTLGEHLEAGDDRRYPDSVACDAPECPCLGFEPDAVEGQ